MHSFLDAKFGAYTPREVGSAAMRGGLDAHSIGVFFARLQKPPEYLRDHLILAAPEHPQPWFQPAMPAPCPEDAWVGIPARLHHALGSRRPDEVPKERLTRYANRLVAERDCQHEDYFWNDHQEAQEQWRKDRERERFLQWPAAWADEQLRRRAQWVESQS